MLVLMILVLRLYSSSSKIMDIHTRVLRGTVFHCYFLMDHYHYQYPQHERYHHL